MSPPAVAIAAVVGVAALALALGAMFWLQRRAARKWASAGGVAVDANGCVALIRERDRRGRWRWTLPKGRIDPGETPEAAAVREVYEESGLRTSIVRPIVVYEGRLHFTYYFEMKVERRDGPPEGGAGALRLVTVAKATELLRSRRDLSVLRRWLELRTRVTSSS
jgi:8-oxo-dGTP pyrophosphatase MutT (NUDIX family)